MQTKPVDRAENRIYNSSVRRQQQLKENDASTKKKNPDFNEELKSDVSFFQRA